MKQHTTNYKDTFIAVSEDSRATAGEAPPVKGDKKTVAGMQYDLLISNPYRFTSDDVLFQVYAERNEVPESEQQEAREQFFSKGQPCMRTSPLTKRYGWGVHNNEEGKIALYSYGTEEYEKWMQDKAIKVVKAMKGGK